MVVNLTVWAGTSVSVHAIDIRSQLDLSGCLASFEDVTATSLTISAGTAVFTGCDFLGGLLGTDWRIVRSNSRVVFDHCTLRGSGGSIIASLYCTPLPGQPALAVESVSFVELANSTLLGAQPMSFFCLNSPGTSGISAAAGTLVRLGRSTVTAPGAVPAVTGGGTVQYEATQFQPPFSGGTAASVPIVTGAGAPPGGVIQVSLRGAPLLPGALVMSFGQRPPVQAPAGRAWVDISAMFALRIGALDPLGSLSFPISVPVGIPSGLVLTFQGVVAPTPNAPLMASSPTILHVL